MHFDWFAGVQLGIILAYLIRSKCPSKRLHTNTSLYYFFVALWRSKINAPSTQWFLENHRALKILKCQPLKHLWCESTFMIKLPIHSDSIQAWWFQKIPGIYIVLCAAILWLQWMQWTGKFCFACPSLLLCARGKDIYVTNNVIVTPSYNNPLVSHQYSRNAFKWIWQNSRHW